MTRQDGDARGGGGQARGVTCEAPGVVETPCLIGGFYLRLIERVLAPSKADADERRK
jgi:hypothetical protein